MALLHSLVGVLKMKNRGQKKEGVTLKALLPWASKKTFDFSQVCILPTLFWPLEGGAWDTTCGDALRATSHTWLKARVP